MASKGKVKRLKIKDVLKIIKKMQPRYCYLVVDNEGYDDLVTAIPQLNDGDIEISATPIILLTRDDPEGSAEQLAQQGKSVALLKAKK